MIIADTSPLNYLILIDTVEILSELFEEVAIPPAVKQELLAPGAAEKVRKWVETSPQWLKVKAISKIDESIRLGSGEIEAISLAVELRAAAILIDDKAARVSAKERKLKVIGTLGILKLAAECKLIDFIAAVEKLRATNFRISKVVLEELLNRYKH
jgi:predicted nucleic acid-binding protein